MNRNIVIGIVISALIHGGVLASSLLMQRPVVTPPDPVITPPPEPFPVDLTPLEPEPAPNQDRADRSDRKDVSPPPKAPEMPGPIDDKTFVQPPQPNLPPDLNPDPNITAIPTDHGRFIPRDIKVIDVGLLTQKPAPRAQIPPQYPFELRNAGIEGEVVVEFIVDANGGVRNPFVVRSTQRGFEAAALQAIGKWKFRPGRKDGRAVNAGRVQQIFTFRIND